MRSLVSVLFALLWAACLLASASSPTPPESRRVPLSPSEHPQVSLSSPESLRAPAGDGGITARAIAYLWRQYNPDVRLLREAPTVAPTSYWLATDNRLAAYAFRNVGECTYATAISATLQAYGTPRHGLIEALQGEIVAWPPYVETQTVVTTTVRGETIKLETRLAGARYADWAEYADLALYGALNAWHEGQPELAHQRYRAAMMLFDGVGFADKAYRDPPPGQPPRYATYKLALAFYVARVLGESSGVVDIVLWAMQAPFCIFDEPGMTYAGGFYTLYDKDEHGRPVPLGDPNTETTAYAVLALNSLTPPCPRGVYLPLVATTTCDAGASADPLQRGVAFLKCRYKTDLGLLQESPAIHWNRYYLTNSNVLATYTLETLGVEPELAAALRNRLAQYQDYDHNGFIEVAWGETIRWPPYHHQDRSLEQIGQACILYEAHDGPGYFYDWSAYANLAFMAVLNEYNQGYRESARRLFDIEMSTFDGYGFPDLAYDTRGGVYETIGPAWALYAAARLGMPSDDEQVNALRRILLEQQDPSSGGFHTHYRPGEPRLADPNVETTCLALLGLHADRQ